MKQLFISILILVSVSMISISYVNSQKHEERFYDINAISKAGSALLKISQETENDFNYYFHTHYRFNDKLSFLYDYMEEIKKLSLETTTFLSYLEFKEKKQLQETDKQILQKHITYLKKHFKKITHFEKNIPNIYQTSYIYNKIKARYKNLQSHYNSLMYKLRTISTT